MNKRLLFLESLVEQGKADSFSRYALALEYRREQRHEDALGAFAKLRELDPGYVPQYLMTGQVLVGLGRNSEARTIFEQGIEFARRSANSHAEGELASALSEINDSGD